MPAEQEATVKAMATRLLDFSAALGLYDFWAGRHLEGVHTALLDLSDLAGRERVLDLGCGTGRLADRIKEAHPDVTVQGIDPGPNMIKAARRRNRRHTGPDSFTVGRAAQLPYAEGQFDRVFSCLVFHLLDEPEAERALREIHRVLKAGGRYLAVEFVAYPAGGFNKRQAAYPEDLPPRAGLMRVQDLPGPSITGRHHARYRVYVRETR
jgi:ubiquinone/menaquinone biosynthesis C-methylase UbiE